MTERIGRREFIGKVIAAGASGPLAMAAGCSQQQAERAAAAPAKPAPHDIVTLGNTGIRMSRLGMGTGMKGWNHQSNQTRLGMEKLTALFRHGYDQGLTYFDLADMYGSHEYVKNAMKFIPRDKIMIQTKTFTRDAEGVRKDIERFRQELGTDYIDTVLLHCLTDADWTTKLAGAMDVLSEAKAKGWIRAHGCSCHKLEALQLAAATPWVEVDLARINPRGVKMDGPPDVVVPVLEQFHARGAGVLGMKICGEGTLVDAEAKEESLRFVLSQKCVDAFCIGFESIEQIDDIITRWETVVG
ncbi:MAG: aldo/keto reductase [Phycisphaerae bacterium]|nr:aldo/keto reductase [Phycisphaerae bacterium]